MRQNGYTGTAKALHWLIALLIFIQFPLAWAIDEFTGIQKFQVVNLHKSLGITVLALMVLRVFWRLFHPAPELPSSMSKPQRAASYLTHAALYLAIFLIALSGWAMISVSDKPSVLFQLTRFPLLPWLSDLPVDQKKDFVKLFMGAHALLGYVLLVLIAVHVAGALYHGILLKDGILSTMKPRFGGRALGISIALFLAAPALISLGSTGEALASEWSVKPEQSQIGFEASGSGYTTKGTIARYRAEIEFDPDEPQQAAVRILLDMTSAATGDPDTDQMLKSGDFFNPAQFPSAQFVARGAKPNGSGRYILDGRLTLRGVTKPVALPFSIAINSGTATVKAETKIDRLDFGVGPESVSGLAVDKDVKLTIDLTAVRLDN
ncbi:MAG: YceI family protein [Rhodomicrobium sp.]